MKKKHLAVFALIFSIATCLGKMDVGSFMLNYYQKPEPARIVELLDELDAMELTQNASLNGFFLEIFQSHPFMLPAWSQKIAGLKNNALQSQLLSIMEAVSPGNAGSIEKLVAKNSFQARQEERSLPRNTLEDFQELAKVDPDFNWSAFFASGKKEYPLAVLKIALSGQNEQNVIDLMAIAARLSIISLSQQQKPVCDIFREYFANAPQEELNAFFQNVPLEDRALFLDDERLETLPPYEEIISSCDDRIISNPFKGIFSDWEHGQKTHLETTYGLIESYIKAAVVDSPQSNPDTIRKVMFAYFLHHWQAFVKPEDISAFPCDDEWEEMWRIVCLAFFQRIREAEQAAQAQYNLDCTPVFKILLCNFLQGCQTKEDSRKYWDMELLKVAEEAMTADHPRASEAALWSFNIFGNSTECNSSFFQKLVRRLTPIKERIDPWFWEMIQGKANITDAWDSRGSGWASSVTEEGWKGFSFNLNEAKRHFEKALELHPERFNPCISLITVYMGLSCDMNDVLRVFKEVLNHDPENVQAYRRALWAMRPRWGGSIQLGRYLALEALNCPRRDTNIPVFGYQCLADITNECGGYGWQNIYLDAEVYEACKKMFDEAKQLFHAYQMDIDYERYLFFWKMATLDYDGAAKIMEHNDCLEVFRAAKDINHYSNFAYPFMTPWYDDIETRLKVFTGKYAKELRAAERQLLENANDSRAFQTLKEIISNGDLPPNERNFLIDFYGRWRMDSDPAEFLYTDYDNNAKLRDILLAAKLQNRQDVVQELEAMGYKGTDAERSPVQTAQFVARYGTPVELLAKLKEQGVPLNELDDSPEGMTPIHFAASFNNLDVIQELVRLGVPVDTRNKIGHTPLHLATCAHKLEAAELLVSLGADPNAQDNDGDNCLIYLPQEPAGIRLYKFFLELPNINVNLANRAGDTPLHYAARCFAPLEAVQMMLDKGADVNARNHGGQTPLDCAEEKQNTPLIELLCSHGAKHGADLPRENTATSSGTKPIYYFMGAIMVVAALGGTFIAVSRRRR